MLKNTNETDFLLSRFDIYIFPMVNIDGVALGNYRGNFAGFDLNRCWLKPDPSKQPEVNIIKNYIKKIAKKQQIELILDLHGHSRKYYMHYVEWEASFMEMISVLISCYFLSFPPKSIEIYFLNIVNLHVKLKTILNFQPLELSLAI